jgi:tRNA-modifying protein YgfZ
MMSNTALREIQSQSGAVWSSADDASGLALHFGSPREEYTAATTDAALFDFSDRNVIELSGSDRAKFLHNFCTNDINRLSAGRGCEAFITNVKGKILGHAWIDAGESALWLDAVAGSAERLLPHLERYHINEDVTITDRSEEWAELLVLGPNAPERLAALGINVASLALLEHLSAELPGDRLRVRRFDVNTIPGFVLAINRPRLGQLWRRLCEANIRPAGSEVWTALRIEAGLPIYGIDITDDNLAQEAGRTTTAISFTKGCYLGQEPIARIDAMGHVNRELRSLRLAVETVPPPGARIFADEAGSQQVGTVTSSAFSPGTGTAVAMGLVRSSVTKPDSGVFIEIEKSPPAAATVFWGPSVS